MKTTKIKLEQYLNRFVQDLGAVSGLPHKVVVTITENMELMDDKVKELNKQVEEVKDLNKLQEALTNEFKYFSEKYPVIKKEQRIPPHLQKEWQQAQAKVEAKYPEITNTIKLIEHGEFDIELKPIKDFSGIPATTVLNFKEVFTKK